MLKKFLVYLICFSVIGLNVQSAWAQDFHVVNLPKPGSMVVPSVPFAPLALQGMVVNVQKPLEFQFLVDPGQAKQNTKDVKDQADTLIKYFLTGLTIPEQDLWVNLSPYEKDRIAPEALSQTELGRDLLAQDYILKQLTASLIYPEGKVGKEFWAKVYKKAQEQFGTINIPINTFNKVWIMPDHAQVYEHGNAVYITKSTLKVMLDEDYRAKQKHQATKAASLSSQIVRQLILPEIEKEVNTGKNFAPLRQIYQALILAKWYKETVKNGIFEAVYNNKNKIDGVNLNDLRIKRQIYERYLQAYKKGVFNYVKNEKSINNIMIPKKYFSGGIAKLASVKLDHGGEPSIQGNSAMLGVVAKIMERFRVAKHNEQLILGHAVEIGKWMQDPNKKSKPISLSLEKNQQMVEGSFLILRKIRELFITEINPEGELYYFSVEAVIKFIEVLAYFTIRNPQFAKKYFYVDIKAIERRYAADPIFRDAIRPALAHAIHDVEETGNGAKPSVGASSSRQTASAAMLGLAPKVESDAALITNGGIDLKQIELNREGKRIVVHFDRAQLVDMMRDGFNGFKAEITNITHIDSPLPFLGLTKTPAR